MRERQEKEITALSRSFEVSTPACAMAFFPGRCVSRPLSLALLLSWPTLTRRRAFSSRRRTLCLKSTRAARGLPARRPRRLLQAQRQARALDGHVRRLRTTRRTFTAR